jgi:glycosyl transferase family 87
MDTILLSRRGLLGGLLAAAVAGCLEGLTLTGLGGLTRANDFCIYWGGIKLLGQGRDPYDLALLAATVHGAGCHALVGTGYSYPLRFAYLLLPLGLLTPTAAWIVFTVLSLGALALAVALLLTPLGRLAGWEPALLAVGAGTFAPVLGSIQVGQANLLLLPS